MSTSKNSCECGHCNQSSEANKKVSLINVASVVMYILFPKCAICWAAYASLFSYLGLGKVEYNPYFQFIVLSGLIIGSIVLLRNHMLKKAWFNIYLYLLALVLMICAKYYNYQEWYVLTLIAILMLASNFSFSGKFPKFQKTW